MSLKGLFIAWRQAEDLDVSVCVTDGKDLYIGKAVQKAYLEVTEEGAEGAVGSGRLHLLFLIFLINNRSLQPDIYGTH